MAITLRPGCEQACAGSMKRPWVGELRMPSQQPAYWPAARHMNKAILDPLVQLRPQMTTDR